MWTSTTSLVAYTVLGFIIHTSSSLNDDAFPPAAILPCPRALAVPMINEEIEAFENGSLLYEGYVYPPDHYWRDNVSNSTLGCICNLGVKCFRKCCPAGEILHKNATCVAAAPRDEKGEEFIVPELRIPEDNLAPDIRNITELEEHFYVLNNRLCPNEVFMLEPEVYPEDEFLINSSGFLNTKELAYPPERYCIDWQIKTDGIRAVVCFAEIEAKEITTMASTLEMKLYPVGMIISIPFMIATLLVYATINELRNLYGKTLMCYVACLIYAYSSLAVLQLAEVNQVVCVSFAFTIHFSFLASFFWLNVMCFDIWWTFGGFRSLQGSIKQRERKKFLMYSIYAWGCAILLTAVCVIMDFVPGIPKHVLRPEFGAERCWFKTDKAKALYFYGPMGVTVICNIILFISTAAKIIRHKKDTAHHLKGMDSKRHDDNKQWFNLYLKLFIVMGINWSMEIISWLCPGPKYIWYLTDIANTLQGVIIFIIFVWKDKIKRLLMKRFNCKGPNFLSRDSTRSATYHSSTSRTCTTSIPLHEKTNSFPDPVSRIKPASDDSDGV